MRGVRPRIPAVDKLEAAPGASLTGLPVSVETGSSSWRDNVDRPGLRAAIAVDGSAFFLTEAGPDAPLLGPPNALVAWSCWSMLERGS